MNGVAIVKLWGFFLKKRDEFRTLVRAYGVRRTLSEVMPHIKEPIPVRKDVELSKVQRRMYNEIKTELKALDRRVYRSILLTSCLHYRGCGRFVLLLLK